MEKPLEVEVRIRHHAKKLAKFGLVMKEILKPLPRVKIGSRNVKFTNKNGEFYIKGWMEKGEYVGVKITRGNSRTKDAVFLRVAD